MTFNPGFFLALVVVGYLLNLAVTRDLSRDRLLLRAPIVAVFATVMYGPVTVIGTELAGAVVFTVLVWKDITPGVLTGAHR